MGMLHHRLANLPLVMGKVRPALKVWGLVTITGLLPTSKGEDLVKGASMARGGE